MIALISPAKTQDFDSPLVTERYTQPRLVEQTLQLVGELKHYSVPKLEKLMSISEKLALLNAERYQRFEGKFTLKNSRQALLAFDGDVYTDIEEDEYSDADFDFAQKHLRSLSGLYGLLRPLDLIQPYRLEMKTPLKTKRGKNLYDFWGDTVTELLNEDLVAQGDDVVVNLASVEYFKVIHPKKMKGRIVTPVFQEKRKGKKPMIKALFAKRARGMMSNFIIRERLTDVEQLKAFTQTGYLFDKGSSKDDMLVFIRNS